MKLLFVTTNPGKFSEAKKVLKGHGINIAHHPEGVEEVRAEDCATVARAAGICAYEKIGKPLFVEDSGLYISALGGFPGAYSAYVHKKIGNKGILKLLEGKSREATFVSCIGYCDEKGPRVFCGECTGRIAEGEKGKAGFGYDPIFTPQGKTKTFAEDSKLKNTVSHRRISLEKFAEFLKKED